MLDAHYAGEIDIADYWAVGDVRTESITEIPSGTTRETQVSQNIDLVIIGINHDDLETPINGIAKGAITVQTKNCLSTTGRMDANIWSGSPRRTWCNDDFFNALNIGISSLIKPVTKKSNRFGYRDSYSNYARYRTQETTTDKVFLLSEWEIYGKQNFGASVYGSLSADGNQYDYMKTGSNILKPVNSANNRWWGRTGAVDESGSGCFLTINTSTNFYLHTSTNSYGIAPAFCL